ncbi:Purine efflux pump PbuE [Gemmata sp. SH-PL17]|uniref:MFS transporter n=1 Tax=Gemmata sp. SH-PL17 TaxID=1630693 RepID=UPI00078E5391|nr:MFS transporter [Gemmata sp. SH-PL17]AMV24872.1 Purine efflux pump PbuE [Gemmata sp. SH-PL17]
MAVPIEAGSQPLPTAKITRAEWGLILVLVAIQFTHMVDFVIIMPLGGRLMRELSLTEGQFAHIVSAYAWAAGVASLLASFVMDRFDRKSVLLTMYAGFTLSTLFCGFAAGYELLLVSRTLAGAFGGTAAVALMAVIGDVFPPEKRGRASGAVISSFAVASIAGLPAGLMLAEWFGRGAPFVALAGLSVLVWVLAWVKLPPIRGHLTAERPNRWAEFAEVVSNRGYLGAFAFSFFLVLGTFTVASFIGPYLTAVNDWTEGQLSQIYFVAGVCTLLGMTVVGRLADRLPRLGLFRVLGSAALVMALVVTNLPPGPLWVAVIVMSGFMVAAAGRMVPVQALLLGVAKPKNRGAFMSVNTSVQHAATGLAPLIAGALVTIKPGVAIGYPNVGWVAAGTAAISLVLAGVLKPARADKSPLDAVNSVEPASRAIAPVAAEETVVEVAG